MNDKYFIVQYFCWHNGYRMNHSFETFNTEFYQLSEVKAVADRDTENNNSIDGYYIIKQEILESNM